MSTLLLRDGSVAPGSAGLWVTLLTRVVAERGKVRIVPLTATNDRTHADAVAEQARPNGTLVSVVRVATLGFGPGELRPDGAAGAWVVFRFEVLTTSSGVDVHGEGCAVAIVPESQVEAFIAARQDVGPRVRYLGARCPLRLSWVN
ncbi:MAG TPA: hypothetical protein ENK57_15765 [Polyangiaceae bacterium]|nr:hypothetical protein [Polyangiaceae bacterium]